MAKKKAEEVEIKLTRPPKVDTDVLIESIIADLGSFGVVLQKGSELEGRFDLRRPSGITSLDVDCGGGLPSGGLSQIAGPDGVGKNLLVYNYFSQVQKLYGDHTCIFMLCMEFPFDKMYARKIGFKVPFSDYEIHTEQRRRQIYEENPLTKIEIAELKSSIGCGEFHILRGPSEANLQAVVTLVDSNAYQIGAIDSWDSMLTTSEDEVDLGDNPKIASASGIQSLWMKKIQGALMPRKRCPSCFSMDLNFKKHNEGSYNYICKCGWKGRKPFLEENETTIIGIRQVRANLYKTNMRQREWKVGGAWALKHGKLIDIQLRPGEVLYYKDSKDSENSRTKIGKELVYEITKGKAGTHEGKVGSFRYYFDPPKIDIEDNMINYCTVKNIIRRGGAVYYIGEEKFSSKEALQTAIREPKFKSVLWNMILKDAGLLHIRYTDIETK